MIFIQNKDLLIFDLDGTIVHLIVKWSELKFYLSERYSNLYGNECDYSSISACLSRIVDKGDEEELQKSFDIIRDYELENIEKTKPIEETIFFINNLNQFGAKEEINLAVFSLNLRETIKRALKISKILERIDFIVGREDVRRWKPYSDGLLKIINHFTIEKDRVIYFGDMEKDKIASEKAGIDFYYINELKRWVSKIKE